jgi:hypothetical protein
LGILFYFRRAMPTVPPHFVLASVPPECYIDRT